MHRLPAFMTAVHQPVRTSPLVHTLHTCTGEIYHMHSTNLLVFLGIQGEAAGMGKGSDTLEHLEGLVVD